MSIHERYRRTRSAALDGLEQVRARLEAAERQRVAQTAQQVAAGQLLLHDPEIRLAMGPEQEAEAYERLNEMEASIGLPPTPYVDVPKQEFAKQIHAGQVTVAERALPPGERETLEVANEGLRLQPRVDAEGRAAPKLVGAEYEPGPPKTPERLAEKQKGEVPDDPSYTLMSAKDHARGVIRVQR